MIEKEKSKKTTSENVSRTVPAAKNQFPSDVLGSYTGKPADGGKPIQDADDL